MSISPPSTEVLLSRAHALAGLSLQQAALEIGAGVPSSLLHHKGWIGQLLEQLLGASAGNEAQPDFPHLGIELKTLPLTPQGKPLESTYISTVPLWHIENLRWEESAVWHKLRHILWIPIIGERHSAIHERIIGSALLWQPTLLQSRILQNDWEEHMEKICLGQLHQLKSQDGRYLQVRPKAANHHALCDTFNEEGHPIKTLPRGFYLRTTFTAEIIRTFYK